MSSFHIRNPVHNRKQSKPLCPLSTYCLLFVEQILYTKKARRTRDITVFSWISTLYTHLKPDEQTEFNSPRSEENATAGDAHTISKYIVILWSYVEHMYIRICICTYAYMYLWSNHFVELLWKYKDDQTLNTGRTSTTNIMLILTLVLQSHRTNPTVWLLDSKF